MNSNFHRPLKRAGKNPIVGIYTARCPHCGKTFTYRYTEGKFESARNATTRMVNAHLKNHH